MSQLGEFIELLIATVEDKCHLDYPVRLDELPREKGLYAEIGTGAFDVMYYDKKAIRPVPVLLLCKDPDQQRCMEQLEDVCNYLQQLKKYPQGKNFCWMDTEIVKNPSKIGRSEDGTYHYSCLLNNKLYY